MFCHTTLTSTFRKISREDFLRNNRHTRQVWFVLFWLVHMSCFFFLLRRICNIWSSRHLCAFLRTFYICVLCYAGTYIGIRENTIWFFRFYPTYQDRTMRKPFLICYNFVSFVWTFSFYVILLFLSNTLYTLCRLRYPSVPIRYPPRWVPLNPLVRLRLRAAVPTPPLDHLILKNKKNIFFNFY